LTAFFKKAALTAVFCLAAGCDNGDAPPEAPSVPSAPATATTPFIPALTPLTKGETALVQSIFGTEINTAIVEKHLVSGYRQDAAASLSEGKTLNFYGERYHSADYSQEKDIFNYGTFVGQMTYVWQIQTNQYGSCDTYQYPLALEHQFNEYCSAQQAAIIEDYARRFLHPSHESSYKYVSSRGITADDTSYSDTLLAKVVEDRFPQARATRLALEAESQTKLTLGTPLTRGEIKLVRSVFGNEINTDIVEKYFDPHARQDAAVTYNAKAVEFYGAVYHSTDYSQETRAFNYSAFLHEMTHVWQNQTNQSFYCKVYDYPLDTKYHFTDYCREQQAAIIQDYSRRFLFSSHTPSYNYVSSEGYKGSSADDYTGGVDTPESDALLAKLVEDQFPQARETRLGLSTQTVQTVAANKAAGHRLRI
jgi:hypothetical protein